MKIIIALIITSFTLSAFAIETDSCPELIRLNLTDLFVSNVDDIAGADGSEIDRARVEAHHLVLSSLKEISVDLTLNSKYDSKCYYQRESRENFYSWAILSGSTREGAVNPATLQVFYSEHDVDHPIIRRAKLITYIPLSDVKETGLTAKYPDGWAKIYYPMLSCGWGDCLETYKSIGYSNKVSVE